MNKDELLSKIESFINKVNKFNNQITALKCLITRRIIEETNSKEHLLRRDKKDVIDSYLNQEKELLFFLDNYLKELCIVVEKLPDSKENIYTSPFSDNFVYFFDSMINQLYVFLESRTLLNGVFKENLFGFFPTKNELGLWWDSYMLRNRIAHFTQTRYLNSQDEECKCFEEFNSRCRIIHLVDKKVYMPTTLIDYNKDETIKQVIKNSIKNGDNPFDFLFPNISAKGKNKKKPSIIHITNDIMFDYASSSPILIDKINLFINSINKVFYNEICKELKDKSILDEYIIGKNISEKNKIKDLFSA